SLEILLILDNFNYKVNYRCLDVLADIVLSHQSVDTRQKAFEILKKFESSNVSHKVKCVFEIELLAQSLLNKPNPNVISSLLEKVKDGSFLSSNLLGSISN